MNGLSLLSWPDASVGAERFSDHVARMGPLPSVDSALIATLERSDLRGRGGGAFPVATKWRAVASNRRREGSTVLVNGCEAEPLSRKDRVLLERRPHLVLDGAAIAARALGATEIVHYIGAGHSAARNALSRALAERPEHERVRSRIVSPPARYVAGEESAAVHFVNDGVALPVATPPRPFERGVGGRPTLVQNVETLAHVALIARYGDAWFRSLGRERASGTALLTVSGAVPATTVIELAMGSTVADAVNAAGGLTSDSVAVLLGGYFGGWITAAEAWGLSLDAAALQAQRRSLGCGVIGVLPADCCGVVTSAKVLTYLAGESARQCGPCTFGLRAIADATARIAAARPERGDLERVRRWAGLLPGRGACRHPDGAAGFLLSALRVFAGEFELHEQHRRCSVDRLSAVAA